MAFTSFSQRYYLNKDFVITIIYSKRGRASLYGGFGAVPPVGSRGKARLEGG